MKETLEEFAHNIPACFLEYQIMINGAIAHDHEKNELQALCEFFQNQCLDDNPVPFVTTKWWKLYSVLHHTVHNTIFLIQENDDHFMTTLADMFIFCKDMEFDVRCQLFLNLIEKIPITMVIKLLSIWFTHEKDNSHRVKLNKALSSCLSYRRFSETIPKIPCTQISTC